MVVNNFNCKVVIVKDTIGVVVEVNYCYINFNSKMAIIINSIIMEFVYYYCSKIIITKQVVIIMNFNNNYCNFVDFLMLDNIIITAVVIIAIEFKMGLTIITIVVVAKIVNFIIISGF